jgi:5-methylcytosine-specific restriction endonuclease McrA
MCEAEGRTTSANTADHVIPHRGDQVKFWFGELQSLCARCHSMQKQREENGGIQVLDEEGWPV